MEVIYKHFTTHKRGETDEDIQDSIGISINNARFALSDGVTRSFLPRLLADILTEAYVNAATADDFPPKDLAYQFANRKEAYLSTQDEFSRTLQEIAEETLRFSAATFAGLEIRKQYVSWKVIGDSCLFIVPDHGSLHCICSDGTHVGADGSLIIDLGNYPAQIHSDGRICGHIISGSSETEDGWYIIMSDAMSAWFADRMNHHEDAIGWLFAIGENEEFEDFVQKEYDAGRLKDDDCSVILIRINNSREIIPVKDEFVVGNLDAEKQDVGSQADASTHKKFQRTLSNITGIIRSFLPDSRTFKKKQEQNETDKELY